MTPEHPDPPAPLAATAPAHAWVLLPGLRVVTDGPDTLRVGLEAARSVRVPRTPDAERVLRRLAEAEVVHDPDSPTLALLRGHGLVMDARALGSARTPGLSPSGLGACATLDPYRLRSRLAARAAARVVVLGSLGAPVDPVSLLAASGVPAAAPWETDEADVVLVLCVGELDRALLDPLVEDGRAHLVVRLLDGTGQLGPFVSPGLTACLRCLDAHRRVVEPRHPLHVAQYAAATARTRTDGVAEPVDAALAALLVAWAVRDVVSHLDGLRPATWSTTLRVPLTLEDLHATSWLRHPTCPCSRAPLPDPTESAGGAHLSVMMGP